MSEDTTFARYMRGRAERKRYGILVYVGDGFSKMAIEYLNRWYFTVQLDNLPGFLSGANLWDGQYRHDAPEPVETVVGPFLSAPQRSNLNGIAAETQVEATLRAMGFDVVRDIKFGRDAFWSDYKWDFVAFTEDAEIYIDVKSQKQKGSMQDKLVKSCESINSIATQLFTPPAVWAA